MQAFTMGRLGAFKEEYLMLWKNAQFSLKVGDYDAYLKNCLGFLSLLDNIELDLSKEEIEANRKDVYNNILNYLYDFFPAFVENNIDYYIHSGKEHGLNDCFEKALQRQKAFAKGVRSGKPHRRDQGNLRAGMAVRRRRPCPHPL